MQIWVKTVQELRVMSDPLKPPEPYSEPPLAHTDALPIGARLSEFEILSLLGVGGFGMVYRAYDHSLHRTVAIKEYMPSALAGRSEGQTISTRSTNDQTSLVTGLRSFVNEARLLAQFEHPSLVKVYRFWEANNTAYMVMPLYSGLTFRQARALMQKPPTEAWLRTVLWSILGALKYLHENNIVHRDVSPDNIFLQDVGPPVLLDLGAARRAVTDATHKHTAILKVNYAPIEQYAGADDMRQGPWTDLYSVAAVMHGCLCNEAPLPATFRVLRDGMPSVQSITQTIQTHFGQSYSSEFVGAISHALAIQPTERPQSVQEFSDEMALATPANVQKFVWRESLGVLSAGGQPAGAAHVTAGPTSGMNPGPAMRSTADPDVTRIIQPGAVAPKSVTQSLIQPSTQPVQSDMTIPGPLAHDSTSLTSDSMFPDFANSAHNRVTDLSDATVIMARSAPSSIAAEAAFASGVAAPLVPVATPADTPAPAPADFPANHSADSRIDSRVDYPADLPKADVSVPAPSKKIGMFAALAAVVLIGGGFAFWNSGKSASTSVSTPVSAPVPAPGLSSATAVVTPPPAAPAAPVRATPEAEIINEKAPVPVAVVSTAVAAAPAVSATRPASAPRSASSAALAAASAAGLPKKPASAPVVPPVKPSLPIDPVVPPAERPATASTDGRPAQPAAPPASVSGAAPERRGPVENCANANFFSRSMCIFNECEKPEYTRLPLCVENRKRLQDAAQQGTK